MCWETSIHYIKVISTSPSKFAVTEAIAVPTVWAVVPRSAKTTSRGVHSCSPAWHTEFEMNEVIRAVSGFLQAPYGLPTIVALVLSVAFALGFRPKIKKDEGPLRETENKERQFGGTYSLLLNRDSNTLTLDRMGSERVHLSSYTAMAGRGQRHETYSLSAVPLGSIPVRAVSRKCSVYLLILFSV